MSPAIRAPRRGGLVPAETLTSAAPVQPDSEPGARWSIVQNNRIAKGVGERALATGVGETDKSVAAIGGNRCSRDVDRAGGVAA